MQAVRDEVAAVIRPGQAAMSQRWRVGLPAGGESSRCDDRHALARRARVRQAGGGPAERAFIGGLWSAGGSAIWPLARLELFWWGIGVRSSTRVLGRLVPAWEARYEDIAGVQRIFVPIANRGVYIRALTAADPVVFWTRRGAAILDHLQLRGVPVDWSVGRGRWGAHLDHHP